MVRSELNAKVDDLGRAGQASWTAMSQALDESRSVFVMDRRANLFWRQQI
ncbi:MAG: hypothetical protein ACR2OF_04665 [Hyphomicrobium sp.]